MKPRILFVDDEALVLQGLRRMLRTMHEEWEMEFIDSGPHALERMAQTAFDVVVSDMCMPGMNGAQLLNEVMKRHPKTVRIILSGHADQQLIMQCVGSTHQYLAKPCEPEILKATIGRASALETSLRNGNLKKLVSQMDRLPSLPSLYVEIIEKLNEAHTSVEQIGRIVAKDIGMTAQILKLVNSAFFGLRRQVSSATEAVSYLGVETIKSLVLSVHSFSQMEEAIPGELSLQMLRNHSLQVADAARAIVLAENSDKKFVDEAFLAGMLHDTGKLVLLANFSKQCQEVSQLKRVNRVDGVAAEEQVFGANHADVGGYLLGLWGLPVPVVEAIAFHHYPGRSHGRHFSPLTAVHLANALVNEQQISNGPSTRIDSDYVAQLGLSGRLPLWHDTVRDSLELGGYKGPSAAGSSPAQR